VARLSKNILIFKDWTHKKYIYKRTRVSRWLGRENEENGPGLGIVVVGLPPLEESQPETYSVH